MGGPVFGPAGGPVVGVAQALPYNANPHHRGSRARQPVVGWDTLNWGGPVPEYGAGSTGCPVVKPGWSAALVPAAFGPAAVLDPTLPADVRETLRKGPLDPAAWTH
jgi:hypothetical protein